MRGDGKTTRQMLAAPEGAYYIWVNANTSYPKSLARKLHREDLHIIGPEHLFQKFAGTTKQFVVDHAAILREEDSLALYDHAHRLRMRGIIK